MPTIDWNKSQWDGIHGWSQAGGEWSSAWGSEEMQWYGSLLPRLQRYLPARRILEIAPGYGRWSRFLAQHCEQLDGVDLSESCIDYCKQRFASESSMAFHVNDGSTLPMILDQSIDLAFSFDSLVHVEKEVIDAYLVELARVLSDQGVAFLHHSNLGAYGSYFRVVKSVKARIRKGDAKRAPADGVARSGDTQSTDAQTPARPAHRVAKMAKSVLRVDSDHSRALSVSADVVRQLADNHDLRCVTQETINWGSRRLIDCISVIARADSKWTSSPLIENPDFMREAQALKRLVPLYG